MRQPRSVRRGIAASAISTILLIAPLALGQQLNEELHKVYPLAAEGRIELDNVNGAVHISTWDRNEVKVDAVKSARTQERLSEARIEIRSDANSLSIRTEYPEHD